MSVHSRPTAAKQKCSGQASKRGSIMTYISHWVTQSLTVYFCCLCDALHSNFTCFLVLLTGQARMGTRCAKAAEKFRRTARRKRSARRGRRRRRVDIFTVHYDPDNVALTLKHTVIFPCKSCNNIRPNFIAHFWDS